MDDQTEGDKKKPRRRGKKKETEEKPESKEKKQTNPPSVPIHELFPTSTYLFRFLIIFPIKEKKILEHFCPIVII